MPPTTSQMANIERSLGELTGGVTAILRELDNLREERREDVNASNLRMSSLEQDIMIAGKTAAQARDVADAAKAEVTTLAQIVNEEIKPQTDNIKRIRMKTMGFMTGLAFFGGALANPTVAAIASAFDKILK